jgi:hypothetical protein
MRSAITLGLGLFIAAAAPGLRAQMDPLPPASGNAAAEQAGQTTQQANKPPAKPTTQTPAKPTPQTASKPAAPAPAKPAAQTPAKPATQGPGKAAAQAPVKPGAAASKPGPQTAAAAKPAATAAKPAGKPGKKKSTKTRVRAVEKPAGPAGAPKAAAESELRAVRRDPFESLVSRGQGGKTSINLPQGKAGLQVSTLRLDGIVRAPNGMIAVVSNPQARTYFLREGDHLYDGSVEKISMDGVSFHEEGKDAFGKPVERQVNKRIYSTSSGEQQ